MSKEIGACDFSKIPEEKYEEILTAIEEREWNKLAIVNFTFSVCPWVYCCNRDNILVLNLFDDAKERGFFTEQPNESD